MLNIDISPDMLKRAFIYLGFSNDEEMQNKSEELLMLMIQDAARVVLNYCHIKRLSGALESVVIQLAVRKFKEENGGALESLKMGDVTFTYTNNISVYCFTEPERAILNAARKVVVR